MASLSYGLHPTPEPDPQPLNPTTSSAAAGPDLHLDHLRPAHHAAVRPGRPPGRFGRLPLPRYRTTQGRGTEPNAFGSTPLVLALLLGPAIKARTEVPDRLDPHPLCGLYSQTLPSESQDRSSGCPLTLTPTYRGVPIPLTPSVTSVLLDIWPAGAPDFSESEKRAAVDAFYK